MPLLFIIQIAHTIKKNPAAHLLTEGKSNLLCLPWLNSPLMDYIKLPFSLSKKLSRFTVWASLPFLQTPCNLQYAAGGPSATLTSSHRAPAATGQSLCGKRRTPVAAITLPC